MVLRLLFVLLVALNIAVGAWLLLGQDGAHVRPATDPGVPVLHLLSEQPATPAPAPSTAATRAAPATSAAAAATVASASSVAVAPAASAPASAPPAAAPPPAPAGPPVTRCLAIGPFDTQQDLRSARATLAGPGIRMRSRQEQTTETRGWWVYLPAPGGRAQALALARRLEAAKVGDYFVVTSGDQPNAISLGLFKDPSNARKRRDDVAAAGFPAQMVERTETVPEYWLDLVVRDGDRFDWRSRLRPAPGVGSHSATCF